MSAQAVGVQGGTGVFEVPVETAPGGLRGADPDRYESLTHPGDEYSYDIFSQAGRAVRGESAGAQPFEGYEVQRLLAMGQSQSAGRLTTYLNAAQPIAGVYDGVLVHSRGVRPASLTAPGLGTDDPGTPEAVTIRTDLAVPVLTLQTESELVNGFAAARQPDTETFRLWEVAGTSHIDGYPAQIDTGDGRAEVIVLDPAQATGGPVGCDCNVNAGVQHAVVIAALAALERWVRDGTAPANAPRLEMSGSGAGATIVRDELGIAVGGVRTPIVDVPIAVNSGEPNTGAIGLCRLFGKSSALDAATLARLYPTGGGDYVAKFDAATDATVEAGFWLEPEARNYKAAARQMRIG